MNKPNIYMDNKAAYKTYDDVMRNQNSALVTEAFGGQDEGLWSKSINYNMVDIQHNGKLCISVKEAAAMCGLCENTMRKLVRRKDFPKFMISRKICIPLNAFIEYINTKVLEG